VGRLSQSLGWERGRGESEGGRRKGKVGKFGVSAERNTNFSRFPPKAAVALSPKQHSLTNGGEKTESIGTKSRRKKQASFLGAGSRGLK